VTRRLRLLIADDHPLFRDGLRSSLGSIPQCTIVGEAGDGAEAVRLALTLRPDVVLMDIGLPVLDGIAATRQIVNEQPAIRVLMVTMHEDDASVVAAVRAGARGYVVKGCTAEDVLRAVMAVAQGEVLVGAAVADRLVSVLTSSPDAPSHDGLTALTARERETLRLIGRGMRNSQIAAQMHVTPKTVRNYVTRIFGKLMVTSRAEAVIRARDGGLS
jgi:DNA-binding NarL/FixJ family response regulator